MEALEALDLSDNRLTGKFGYTLFNPFRIVPTFWEQLAYLELLWCGYVFPL